ncbi:hypothetical protein LCGC14_3032160 [marine sediment metagenome]|uniref:Uncharacterized protein n=1 Tax=marine sediment metagenome TaxID=412755 RepID=A0A0F8XF98_9ZZZZ
MNSNAIREKFGGDYIADGEKQQGKVLNFDRDHDKCEENRIRSSFLTDYGRKSGMGIDRILK